MSGLLRAELLKLRTVRTTWILVGIALAIVLGVDLLALGLMDGGATVDDGDVDSVLSFTAIGDLLLLSLGIVSMAGEFRHGTVTSSFLATPSRWPVIAAKALAVALVALLYAAVALALTAAVGLPWLAAEDANLELGGGDAALAVTGRLLYAAISAVLGVGVGAVLRNQAAGLTVALVALLAVEPALAAVSEDVAVYGPTGAGLALFGGQGDATSEALPFGLGGLVYFGYAALLVAAGCVIAVRRDVS